jgi:hypothetical protein
LFYCFSRRLEPRTVAEELGITVGEFLCLDLHDALFASIMLVRFTVATALSLSGNDQIHAVALCADIIPRAPAESRVGS